MLNIKKTLILGLIATIPIVAFANSTNIVPIVSYLLSDTSSSSSTTLNSKEKLGEALFFDKNLSLSRNTSCATCHDPDHAFMDVRFLKANADQGVFIHGALSVGDDGHTLGGRNAPSITYRMLTPDFDIDSSPVVGGQFHDGRASTLKDQAMGPPLDMAEMMMPDAASVVTRIKQNPLYVSAFKALFNDNIFYNDQTAFEAMGEVIGKFEKTDIFAPFDSKFDRYLQGTYTLTPTEQRGLD